MSGVNESFNNAIELPPEQSSLGSAFAWMIWSVAAVFVLFQFFIQLSSGVIVEGLMKSFSLTAFGGGLLASAYYYVYTLLQAPAGFVVDRYGTRRVLSVGAAICGLGCVLFAVSNDAITATIGRLIMGTGASFAFVGAMNLVASWFPRHRYGFMAAMAETMGMVGSIFGSYSLAHLVQHYGWRSSMEGAAALALIIALLLGLIVRNAPKNSVPIEPHTPKKLWEEMKLLVKKPIFWFNGIYGAAFFAIITVFIALWAIPFMQKVHHLTLSRATLLCNFTFIGVAIGAPIYGWVDNHFRSRRALMAASAFSASAILFIIIFDTSLSMFVLMGLMLLLGFVTSAYVLNYVIANELANPKMRGGAVGFTNMMCVGSAPIMQPLVGLMLYLLSDHVRQTTFDAYSIAHFQLSLLIIPLFILVAGVLSFWLPNRKA